MPPRVGSALDHLAAAIVALAVFALPISCIVAATGHDDPLFLLSLGLGFVVTSGAVVRLVAGPDWPSALAAVVGAGVVTWGIGFFAFLIGYDIKISQSLCGGGGGGALMSVGALVIYAIVGSWALTGTGGPRFFLGPSLGAVLGIAWVLTCATVLPGGHGYCET